MTSINGITYVGRIMRDAEAREMIIPENGLTPNLRKKLSKGNACYVLITCANPSSDGKMQVEMTYEGDVSLAAMLIEHAQDYIQEE